MKPIGIIGIILIVGGAIVLALGGFSFVKDRSEVSVGPVSLAAEERGFVPPVVGIGAIVVGLALVVMGRRA